MNKKLGLISLLCCAFLLAACGSSQTEIQSDDDISSKNHVEEIEITPENADEIAFQANDYINAPGPFSRQGKEYQLTRSLPSQNGYYIQEYITPEQNIEKFEEMFIVNAQEYPNITTQFAIDSLTTNLDASIQNGEYVRYEIIECPNNTNEQVIEFEMADSTVIERNMYRYKTITSNQEVIGISRFALSKRDYTKTQDFRGDNATQKANTIQAFCDITYPDIII